MAPLRERCNLFKGAFRVAPAPVIPEHWKVSREYPSATRFWVHDETGEAAAWPAGEEWEFRETLRDWQTRQALRVWIGRRLLDRFGSYEAEHRVRKLESWLKREVPAPNAYLDLVLSIAFEAYFLVRLRRERNRLVEDVRDRARADAAWWRERAALLEDLSPETAVHAAALADEIAAMADAPVSPGRLHRDHFRGPFPDEVSGVPRQERRATWRWVDYQMRSSRMRNAGIGWLLARAILAHRTGSNGNRDSLDYLEAVETSRERVLEYLDLLDVFPAGPQQGGVRSRPPRPPEAATATDAPEKAEARTAAVNGAA